MKATKRYSRVQNNETRTRRGTRGSLLKTRPSSRRGVLLLVILGMLTLFLMIGTAFIMSGNQYRRANKTYSKVGEQKNLQASQEGFLAEVINQIIRDTANQNSSLRFHSLLRDLYGTEGLFATIPTTAPLPNWAGDLVSGTTNNVTAGQMLEFQIPVANFRDYFGNALATGRLSQLENFYKGQVLTFLDGVAKGRTTRVMGYYRRQVGAQPAATDPAILRVLSVTLENSQPITDPRLLAGSRILINGRPFNGMGVGYNALAPAGAAKLSAAEQIPGMPDQATLPTPIALMPNAAFFDPGVTSNVILALSPPANALTYYGTTVANTPTPGNRFYDGLGGSDESYDAPDFQNMFLAWTAPNPVETIFPNFDGTPEPGNPSNSFNRTNLPPYLGTVVLPSFHRPDLINYWAQLTKSGSDLTLGRDAAVPLLRKVLLRPNWHDHPDFDGSNPEFAKAKSDAETNNTPDQLLRMIYGPWDVDNDMDGIRDSVWVDFGAPVMVGSKGRLVKPLAAIMVLDMDGRLNVNAHGTRELAGMGGDPIPAPTNNPATGATWNIVPRGQAFGVAEIDLGQLLDNDTLRRLMSGESRDVTNDGNNDLFIAGRYGSPFTTDNEPGTKDAFDLSAQLKMQGFPFQANGSPLVARSNFGTLPDLRARYKTALNDFGQFVTTWTPVDSNAHSLVEDNPYELDLSTTGSRGEGTSVDNPFSVAELERLLRAYDLDAGTLSPRLFELLKGDQPNAPLNDINNWRTLLTTDSYDLPEPGVQLPSWVRTAIPNVTYGDFATVMGRQPVSATFADLIEYRLRASQNPAWVVSQDGANPTRLPLIQRQMKMLIAPEMMAGLKLDLNRPIGNGRDDNNNGVVDEPGENEGAFWAIDTNSGTTRLPATVAAGSAAAIDVFNNNTTGLFRDDYDRDGNGLIEPWEQTLNYPTDLPSLVNLHNYRRQLLARHLYVLAYSLIDPLQIDTNNKLPQASKLKARQLAQWAINAVDFRDPDNIMTAFEYDENPFDGWDVDGDIRSTSTDNSHAQRAVVWGMERPDLLITETLAWHDRRTTDTAREEIDPIYLGTRSDPGTLEDSDPKKRDPHMDQQYRPKGAAFIELYNPNAPSAGASADTHAVQDVNFRAQDVNMSSATPDAGTDLGVNLSAVAIDPEDNTRRSPVWRIQVVRNRKKSGTTYSNDLNEMLLFYDPEDRESLPADNRPDVDRTIYFATQSGIGPAANFPSNQSFSESNYQSLDNTDGVEFFTNLGIRPVRPGSYMVIGSGERMSPTVGSRGYNIFRSPVGLTFVNNDPAASGKIGRRIELHADVSLTGTRAPVQVFNSAAQDPAAVSSPKNPNNNEYVADVAIINRVIDRTRDGIVQGPADRAFTFSEPANGYPTRLPNLGSLWSTTNLPAGGPEVEGMYVNGPNSSTPLPFDIPLDDNETAVRPTDPDLRHYGTVQGYRWIYLQRLANPLLPFNPEQGEPGHDQNRPVNPYMTIDHSSVNLSVFNGMINSAIVQNSVNPESNFGASPALSGELSSVERGWRNDPADLAKTLYNAQNKTNLPTSHNNANPYNVETSGKRPRDNSRFPAGSGHFFNAMPDCSLGHLNQGFTQNYVANKVTPIQPFPWLTWNNRPFANAGELLFVPAMRSSQLLRAFSMLAPSTAAGTVDSNLKNEVYAGRVNNPINPYGNPYYPVFAKFLPMKDGPFAHLLNFFRTNSAGPDNQLATADDQGIAGLHRVLDFVSVPSMYVGNETWLNPMAFGDTSTPVASTADPRYGMQPPFNKIASRREPGKVNINTISSPHVWDGALFHRRLQNAGQPWNVITNNYLTSSGHTSALFMNDPMNSSDTSPDKNKHFVSSRRGYIAPSTTPPGQDIQSLLNGASPTLFANPFRTSSTGDLVPLSSMVLGGADTTALRTIDGTVTTATPGKALNAAVTTEAYRNANRNPYFRYSPISRLSSLTTTRSNVFAIWVTVGFFEVEEVDPWIGDANQLARYGSQEVYNRVYPDGYRFGKEAGIETGEVERIREFAIVDRTIPVAFEPGANHNIGEMIRLRRKIKTD